MRNRSPAKSAASSPPVPARISRMTLRSSIASLGTSASLRSRSSAARFLLELRLLGGGHRAHFRIGRRVGDERIEARDLGNDGAIVLHRLDDGSELGELARELDVGLGRYRAR